MRICPYVAMQTGGLMGGWTVMTLGEAMGSDTHLRAAAATAPRRGLAKTGVSDMGARQCMATLWRSSRLWGSWEAKWPFWWLLPSRQYVIM